ncbi:GlsB/YeaQ/YmgE family stress response membrane protein [Frigidibacter sp. MR17.24]|uniref:GlsB/YeaQ/YmgE family stress response membrane protein n=1 Tax=Frigidibacter sp. MR17.24 TaxID=3127345 RepID=UPI003012EC92
MTGVGWIMTIIVGALAGWIAEKIMKADHGIFMNIILGILGAVILNWILALVLGASAVGLLGNLIVAIVGACLLIAIGRMMRGRHA